MFLPESTAKKETHRFKSLRVSLKENMIRSFTQNESYSVMLRVFLRFSAVLPESCSVRGEPNGGFFR